MNATRWQGLYKMVNRNHCLKKWLALALTGTEGEDMEADEQVCHSNNKEEEEEKEEEDEEEREEEEEEEDPDKDDDDKEGLLDADKNKEQVQANEADNKKFPLAFHLLDKVGFKNNSYLENTLFSANEVSGLVQKQEGMCLSMGYQMAKVLKDEMTGMKLMVVSCDTKEGDWKETHASALPNMFKVQRCIFAEQLELRFKVHGTSDKHTLLVLKLDPSVNTTQEDIIFSKRTAAQLLMAGEYLHQLVRWHKLMVGLLALQGLPLQDERVLLRSSLVSVLIHQRGQQTVLPRRGQRAFSHALTTQTRGSTWSRLCELIPTLTIPSQSSSLRRPSMPPSVCLSSTTHNCTWCPASSTSQSFCWGRRVSFLCTTVSGWLRWGVPRW